MSFELSNDTIVAQATPPGRGGVGIVRVSGPATKAIAEAMLGHCPPLVKPNTYPLKIPKASFSMKGSPCFSLDQIPSPVKTFSNSRVMVAPFLST